jgi:hypothetical protein
MKRKCAMLLLVCALAGPGPVHATSDDMFGMMFRMMLTMMNVMSDAMLGNNTGWGTNNWTDNFDLGGMNSFNVGMNTWPMMSGLGSPFTSFGYSPFNTFGMSPWSGMSGMSPWSGMSGMSPWSGMSGMSPWSLPLGSNPWGNPFGGGTAGTMPGAGAPFNPFTGNGQGYPPNFGNIAPGTWNRGSRSWSGSLLDGRWYGSSGEILEIRGNRFRLQQGKIALNGTIRLENDIVTMYSPQTKSATRYTFMRNQSGLLLQDASGNLLRFTNKPVNGIVHIF